MPDERDLELSQEPASTLWENIAAFVGESRLTQEQALEAVLRSGRCLLWQSVVYDADSNLVWHTSIYNENAAQVWLPVEIEPGQTYALAWWASRLPEDRERTDTAGNDAVRISASRYEQDYRVRRLDGEIVWIHEDATIESLGEGRWRVVGVCTDITESKRSEEVLAVQAKQQATVAAFARHAVEELNLARLCRQAALRLSETLDVSEAIVWELLPDEQTLLLIADARPQRDTPLTTTLARAMVGYAIQSETSVIVANAFDESRFDAAAMRASELHSGIGVLLKRDERVFGALGVYTREPRVFSEQDVHFCETIAGILAGAFQRDRTRRLSGAQQAVAEILIHSETPKDACPRVIEALCEHLQWDFGEVWGWSAETGGIRRLATRKNTVGVGVFFQTATRNMIIQPGTGMIGMVWESGKPMWIADIAKSNVLLRKSAAQMEGLQCAVAFPILIGSEPIGVMTLFSTGQRVQDDRMVAFFSTIGRLLGQYIERSNAQNALSRDRRELDFTEESGYLGNWTYELAKIL